MDGFSIKRKRKVFEEDSIYEDENSLFDDNDSFVSNKNDKIKKICIGMSQIEISENEKCYSSNNQEHISTENISSENANNSYSNESNDSVQKCQFKYKLDSFTNPKIKYMINEDFTECTCESFKYSLNIPKTCKHIEYCKKVDISTLKLV